MSSSSLVFSVIPEGPTKTSTYTKMRAFSLSEENSERGMLTTINYLAKTEKNGETGINPKTT